MQPKNTAHATTHTPTAYIAPRSGLTCGGGETNNCIKAYRKKQGLTQTDLANRAGLNIRQIQKIENGEAQTENVTLKTMQAIAQALHVKIDDLIS